MSLKTDLEEWQRASTAFENGDHDTALHTFIAMPKNAKVHFNIGLIFAAAEEYGRALVAYNRAINMDEYMAVAHFQKGISLFLLRDFDEAIRSFDSALEKLRGNQIINYSQLGLAFRLYACEVFFNRGMCKLYTGRIDAGLNDLYSAQQAKMTEEHDVVDHAIQVRGEGFSVFSIPPGILFRPPENLLRQMQNTDMFTTIENIRASKDSKITNSMVSRNNSVMTKRPRWLRRKQDEPSIIIESTKMGVTTAGSTAVAFQKSISRPGTPDQGFHNPDGPPVVPIRQRPYYPPNSPPKLQTQPHFEQPVPYRRCSPSDRWRADSVLSGNTALDNDLSDVSPTTASTTSFGSVYHQRTDSYRVDSGFESSHEDKLSSSLNSRRSSSKTHASQRESPPSVPQLPRAPNMSAYDDLRLLGFGSTDQEMGDVYGAIQSMSLGGRDQGSGRFGARARSRDSGQPMERVQTPQPSVSTSSSADRKLKIKVHYTDTRVLLVSPTVTFSDLLEKVRTKFDLPNNVRLQYKDEDNEMVLMIDDEDLLIARQCNNARNESNAEKLEIWCLT